MIDELKFQFVYHHSLGSDLLVDISKLKMQHWNYPLEEHLKWINKHINSNDLHLLMYRNSALIGYVNLVERIINSGDRLKALGIGNVCIANEYQRVGYGILLISAVNSYLKENKIVGILFCKEYLNSFYTAAGWIKYHKRVYDQNNRVIPHEFFFYNARLENVSLEGDLF